MYAFLAEETSVVQIFGASKDDIEQLRIVELQVGDVKQKKGLFGIF